MLTIAAGAGFSLLTITAVGVLVARSARSDEERPRTADRSSSVFEDGKYQNLIPGDDPMARGGMVKTMREFMFDDSTVRVPTTPPPMVPRRGDELDQAPESGLRITWLGHSTMLIELDGRRVLTDPVWGERASPVGFAGPRRFFAPPLPLDQLPPIDAVLISHDHYDHLDRDTIKAIQDKVALFVVPLKVGEHLRGWGVPDSKIRELDWWQEIPVAGLRLVCTPARHFSGRGLFDRNTTLWSSWAVLGPEHRVYFSGDGGMSPSFAEIGERFGPFDVTMMEVGAYHPNWADIHSGPEQAIQAHRDLRGGLMLPIHWGTFNLAMHGWTEPAERLLVAAQREGVRLAIPRPGESVDVETAAAPTRWWPELPWKTVDEMPVVSPGLEPAGQAARTAPEHEARLAAARQ